MKQEQIHGTWRSDPTDSEGIRAFGRQTLEFRPTGQLVLTAHGDVKDQISLLTYRVDGDWIVTDQPSRPGEEHTEAVLTPDGKLVLKFAGEPARFVRAGV